jgi:hypothetical protein
MGHNANEPADWEEFKAQGKWEKIAVPSADSDAIL